MSFKPFECKGPFAGGGLEVQSKYSGQNNI